MHDPPSALHNLHVSTYMCVYLFFFQAKKVEDIGQVNFQEEIKNRFKMSYIPNWFNVDLKTGVSILQIKKGHNMNCIFFRC